MKTLYDLLDVRPDADVETLKKAFRKAVKAHHPDLHAGDPDAPSRFRQVAAANALLRDANRRAAYDQLLELGRFLELERQQLRSERLRTIVERALVAAVVSVALVGGYALFEPIRANSDAMPGSAETARTETTGQDGPRNRPPDVTATSRLIDPGAAAPEMSSDGAIHGAASAVSSNDGIFYRERGIGSYRSGDFHRAITDLDQAILLDANDAQAYHVRGNAWDHIGASDRALADYDEAIRIDPDNSAVFHDRGILWRRKGELDRALVDLDRAIRFSFSDAGMYGDRGLIWYEKGRYDRAIADFKKAIKIEPSFAVASSARGIAPHRKGEFDRAFAEVDQAIRTDPNIMDVIRRAGLRP
jgi:tetratricopeptide (TPR) repeat protein